MELIKGSAPGAEDQQQQQQQKHPQSNVFDELRQEIDKIDPYAETITLTYHLRQFALLFLQRVSDDQTLNALFAELNNAALDDNKFAVKMATVFGSHQLGHLVVEETKIRNAMIGTLQQNFLAIERLKQANMQRFYNSVTLLGEYYNRKKVLNGRRINILGQSLLLLLTSELELEITKCTQPQQQQTAHQMDANFAKLVLEQITLNGAVAKEDHRKEITDLLFTIRKVLITVPNLCARSKAFLLMALDLYHANLAEDLFAKLYNKYLQEPQQPAATAAARTGTTGEPVQTVHVVQQQEQQVNVESKQPMRGDCAKKSSPEKSTPEPKVVSAEIMKPNSNARGKGGKTPAPQNTRTHDKENNRLSTSRSGSVVGNKKTSPPSQVSGRRNVRLSEDGNIVATITRDVSTTSPTKKAPPTAPSSVRSPAKNSLSPRMEKLAAAVPKITISTSTPSPKRSQQPAAAALSPRPIIGVAAAKQQPQRPKPKSPIRTTAWKKLPKVKKQAERSVRPDALPVSQKATVQNRSPRCLVKTPPPVVVAKHPTTTTEADEKESSKTDFHHPVQASNRVEEAPEDIWLSNGSPSKARTDKRVEEAPEEDIWLSNGSPTHAQTEHSTEEDIWLSNGSPSKARNEKKVEEAPEEDIWLSNGSPSHAKTEKSTEEDIWLSHGSPSHAQTENSTEEDIWLSTGSSSHARTDNGCTETAENGAIDHSSVPTTTQPKVKSCFLEENMEHHSWNAASLLDDDSPTKVNPYMKSFLSFLTDA